MPRPLAALTPSTLIGVALLWALPAVAQPGLELGETTFPNSGAPEAQEPFLRGVLLLHSFEYDDAREAFQEARALDPDFSMAAWGEAMTHNHPIWQRQDRDAALAALEPLGAGWAEAGETAREDAYLATLAVLYGEGAKEDRDDAYADAMRGLAARFPDDLDARAFYALALLGTAHEGRDYGTYMEAAAVAEEVFDQNPRHPGAAHYLIHAYDDPVHAPLGLRPARVYADVAPAASHALHMPSHIYLALGMWEETAEMNRRSYNAAKAGTDRKGLPLNGHGWHALAWWHYAELQRERTDEADRLLAVAQGHRREDPSATAHGYTVSMEAQSLFEGGAGVAEPFDLADAPAYAKLRGLYATVLAATYTGAVDVAAESGAEFAAVYGALDDPSPIERAAAETVEGLLAAPGGDMAVVLDRLREGAEIEQAAPLAFGPPAFAVSPTEAYAAALAAEGRSAEAVVQLQAALARTPGRTPVLKELVNAAEAAGLDNVAAEARRDLAETGVALPPAPAGGR